MSLKKLIFIVFLKCNLILGINNACKNFEDYFTAQTNKNCFYNADMHLETSSLIKKYIGRVERYKVETEDGYILTMFRIPRNNSRDAILLQHPLAVNSRVWVGQGNDSIAFRLWHLGYDVWLNNARGTLYSEAHKKYNIKSPKFWNYSFHEIGYYDIPSQIKLIKAKTNRSKILYLGHSMGTTSALIYASLRPQEAKDSIKVFALLAIPAYFKHATTPLKLLTPYESFFRNFVLNELQLGNVLPLFPLSPVTTFLFKAYPILLIIINFIISAVTGWTPDEVDPAILNYDATIFVKNFSWKILIHYLQLLNSETRFQMFDYGPAGNLELYKSELPPRYPIENITVPLFIVSSVNDTLTTLKDSDLVFDDLPDKMKIYKPYKVQGLNHLDYFIGKHPKDIFYNKLFELFNSLSK